jgi:hypothetical protein
MDEEQPSDSEELVKRYFDDVLDLSRSLKQKPNPLTSEGGTADQVRRICWRLRAAHPAGH